MKESKRIEVKYYTTPQKTEVSHSSCETWEKRDEHCPSCGKQEVWSCEGNEDYYAGIPCLCLNCEAAYSMNDVCTASYDQDKQRLAALQGEENHAKTR